MSDARPIVIVWPHEQQDAEDLARERGAAPAPGTDRPKPTYVDPVWKAVGLPKAMTGSPWATGYGEVITALELQRLVVEAHPSPGRPLPNVRDRRWGEIYRPKRKPYDVFRPTLSLNSDGPTIPSLRMVQRLIAEQAPSLIVNVGLGGGVNGADRVGDVVVATHAKFDLPEEYRTIEHYGATFGGELAIDRAWFTVPPLEQDLPLLPTSNHYTKPHGGWPQPDPHQPEIRVEKTKPVITRPSISGPSFLPAGPKTMWIYDRSSKSWVRGPNTQFLGEDGAAVDMDSAVVAKVCQAANIPFVTVIGVCVPALDAQPFASDVRPAWAATYQRQFGQCAARNAVAVAEELIERLSLGGGGA